jgi:hypothetical protein
MGDIDSPMGDIDSPMGDIDSPMGDIDSPMGDIDLPTRRSGRVGLMSHKKKFPKTVINVGLI